MEINVLYNYRENKMILKLVSEITIDSSWFSIDNGDTLCIPIILKLGLITLHEGYKARKFS